jgi:demethylmenaquinone methyltransferase/2-methoxy-6-polyprenyl-1,4-benzoquinol methylase
MNLFDLISPIYEKIISADEETFKTLFELGDLKITDRVLDLGGGTGRVAKSFLSKVKEIAVLDGSKGMILQCQKKGGINCVFGKADNIPFEDGHFDKIIIIDAFHHFQNKEKAVQEIKRVLKGNGKAIIEEVNFNRFGNWLVEKLETIFGAKSKIYSPELTAEFFSKNGFKIKILDKNKNSYYLIAEKS